MVPKKILFLAAGLIIALIAQDLLAGKLYRWVDEHGITHFGDRVPPEFAKQERQILDEHGRQVEVLAGEKTDAELAAELEAEKAAEAKAEQRIQDQQLLQSYASEREIQEALDARVAAIERLITAGKEREANLARRLDELKARMNRAGTEAPPAAKDHLQTTIAGVEAELADAREYVKRQQEELAATREEYGAKLERFQALKRQATAQSAE